MIIFTIGHSSHDLATFFSLLEQFQIRQLVDIRRSPRSTRFPHFNRDQFKEHCASASIGYTFLGDILGGRRRRRKSLGDLNGGLSEVDARAYADHMQCPEFRQTSNQLMVLSTMSPLVLMCSENDPDECHRSLLADFLTTIHHAHIVHILRSGQTREHVPHPSVRYNTSNDTCIYPQ